MKRGQALPNTAIEEIRDLYRLGYTTREAADKLPYALRTIQTWYLKFRRGDFANSPRTRRNDNPDADYYGPVKSYPVRSPNCLPSVMHKLRAGRA